MANRLKQALARGEAQIGLWIALGNPYTAEICAGAGFDWLLFDGEHSPIDVPVLVSQLQAVTGTGVEPVARPPFAEPWIIKQYLDIGIQSLLVPLVQNSRHAAEVVAMTRYPPEGIRGVGAAIARASNWNRDAEYLARANDDVCLLIQVETREALEDIAAIAATDGVDGVFLGAADLSAALGYRGQPSHPEVVCRIEEAIGMIRATGKASGALTSNIEAGQRYLELGCTFVGVGNDVGLLTGAVDRLAAAFGRNAESQGSSNGPY
jgi:4-hydroxy-2-oxoheptanedioate aldolase